MALCALRASSVWASAAGLLIPEQSHHNVPVIFLERPVPWLSSRLTVGAVIMGFFFFLSVCGNLIGLISMQCVSCEAAITLWFVCFLPLSVWGALDLHRTWTQPLRYLQPLARKVSVYKSHWPNCRAVSTHQQPGTGKALLLLPKCLKKAKTRVWVQSGWKGGTVKRGQWFDLLTFFLWDFCGKCGRIGEMLPCCGIPSPRHLSLEVE